MKLAQNLLNQEQLPSVDLEVIVELILQMQGMLRLITEEMYITLSLIIA